MLKKTLSLLLLFASGVLFADVVPVDNTRDGYPAIIPQVKSLKPAAGTFALPARLTVAAPEDLELAPLAKVSLIHTHCPSPHHAQR